MPAIRSFFITSNSLAGQGRLAENLAEDIQDGGEVGALGLDRERDAAQTGASACSASSSASAHAATAAEPGEVFVERSWICWRFNVFVPRVISSRQEAGGLAQALEVLGVAVVQGQSQLDRLAPGLLGKEGELDSADRLGPLHAGLDGQRARRRRSRSDSALIWRPV